MNGYVIRIIDYERGLVKNGSMTTDNKESFIMAPTRGACTAWLTEKGFKKYKDDKDSWYHNSGQDKVAKIHKAKAIQ